MIHLPEAAQYSAWSYKRGVEHGQRIGRQEILDALEDLSDEIKTDVQRKINENNKNR